MNNLSILSPLQPFCKLTGKLHAVGYNSYTNRCVQLELNKKNDNL
jgi:hypothetical protein